MKEASTYLTIASPTEAIVRDRGSKFIGLLYPVADREMAKALLQKVRDAHPKANHHCFAWRLGAAAEEVRDADDGEPAGSAGRPMMNALRSAELTQVLAVVVRYFGGTKLGIPGLIAAYEGAVRAAIDASQTVTRTVQAIYELKCDYGHVAHLRQQLGTYDVEVVDEQYASDHAVFTAAMAKDDHGRRMDAIRRDTMQLHSIDQWDASMDAALAVTFKHYAL